MNQPNILLIVMDTARAQNVLDRREVMPNLHRIANEGVTFTNAFTNGPWTLPSHASMFTGQYTSDHGTYASSKHFEPEVPTLAERLQETGYQTVSFSNNTWISPEFGFDRGFEDFFVGWELFDSEADLVTIAKENDTLYSQLQEIGKELFSLDAPHTLLNALYAQFIRRQYDSGALVTNWRIKRWLSKQREPDRPFFMFVNYLEPHLEYDPPGSFRDRFLPDDLDSQLLEQVNQDAWAYIGGQIEMDDDDFRALEALYKAELHYLDHRLGKLYDYLDENELLEDTALLIVGDHGENLGEHGFMDHQYCLYDTLLHVPLIARYSDSFSSGIESEAMVELRDLYPTILELADVDVSTDSASSTKSVVDGPDVHREHVIAEYITPQPSMEALENRIGEVTDAVRKFDRGLRSVRTDEWKYIEGTDGSTELYNVRNDPSETDDLSKEQPDVMDSLASVLISDLGEQRYSENEPDEEMDPAAKQRLEDLGYL